MTTTQPIIENLVFEGGGAKGAAYAGCLPILEKIGVYKDVKRIAGTSAGAITASLLATGGGSAGLIEAVKHTDFRSFVTDPGGFIGDIIRLFKRYGLHTGDPFAKLLKTFIRKFSGHANLTFKQLSVMANNNPERFKHLTIVASNLNLQTSVLFNAQNYPDLPIWKAVRASMSIPFVFDPIKIEGHWYVDGGLADNYPIDVYDEKIKDVDSGETTIIRNDKTLGFFLSDHHSTSVAPSGAIHSLPSFAVSVASYLNETANRAHIHPDDRLRTVCIDDLGVKATDFDISTEKVTALMDSGHRATKLWFDQFDQSVFTPSPEDVAEA